MSDVAKLAVTSIPEYGVAELILAEGATASVLAAVAPASLQLVK
jgi:hypothetical protein